jgi:hypothetical protein
MFSVVSACADADSNIAAAPAARMMDSFFIEFPPFEFFANGRSVELVVLPLT